MQGQSNNPWAPHMQPQAYSNTYNTAPQHDGYYEDGRYSASLVSAPAEAPPAYQEVYHHQSYCNGTCGGRCNGTEPQPQAVQYQSYPDESRASGSGSGTGLRPAVDKKQSSEKSIYDSSSTGSLPLSRSSSAGSDDEILQRALGFTSHPPPPCSSQSRLRRPVAVPQVAPGPGMPFVRVYAPVLAEHGIAMEEFVEFVDNLNVVSSSSPPLQVLGLASNAISMIPIHHAQLIGMGVKTLLQVGNVALMKTRGSMFMKKANSDFFNPRGLKVTLANGDALKVKLGLDPTASLAGPVPQGTQQVTALDRKLAALQGLIEPLTFDVPPPNKQTNMLNELCAKQQAMNTRRQEKKALEDRSKYHEKSAEIDADNEKEASELSRELRKLDLERQKEERKRDKELEKVNRKEKGGKRAEKEAEVMRDFDKEMRKLDKEYQKLHKEYDEELGKNEKDRKKEDKEGKKVEKGQWILVESL